MKPVAGDGDEANLGGSTHASGDDARRKRYAQLIERHRRGGVELPQRASYQHTVDRVLSMSEKALANRIRAIERARGKFCVVKMRMFAEVLLLEGYDELARDAGDALQRLLAHTRVKQ